MKSQPNAAPGEVLIDQFLDHELGLRPNCGCGHSAIIPPSALARIPRGTPLERVKARLRCAGCGNVGIGSAQVVAMTALGAYPRQA